MAIDTSQVGQNFALFSAEATQNSRPVAEAQNVSAQTTQVLATPAETVSELGDEAETLQIETAVSDINEFVQNSGRQLDFSVDEGSDRQVVRVSDPQSGEVIRQIPSEEVLELSQRLQDLQSDVGVAVGLLFDRQV